jgi:phosphoribosyl 1,2-cyclic phosphodiesterase
MYQILSTGSKGNAIIYFGEILLDCGVSFSLIKPHLAGLKIVLLTHVHKDHINLSTLKKIQFERPSIRIGAGEHMKELLTGFKNVDYYKPLSEYLYNEFTVSPVVLYHDVTNFGYRLKKDGVKIFHATDTSHLNGIEAKGYDFYCIEANYNEDTVFDVIREKQSRGEFAHQRGAINSHLSEQKAMDFFYRNKGENSQLVRLHISESLI